MKHPYQAGAGPSYRLHWCAVLAVAALLAGMKFLNRGESGATESLNPTPHEMAHEADWYLLVRCPEMPMEVGGAEAGRRQLRDWIDAARGAGFHTVALEDVMSALVQGRSLPENAIVLMFDPSYRSTIEQMLPLLEANRVPALWVTRSPGRIRPDRRFVPAHTRRTLGASPLWDFALGNPGGFVLEGAADGSGARRQAFGWDAELGVTGVNVLTNHARLRRLHANARWSAEEFVGRLLADVPLREARALSVCEIDDRLWGVVLPRGQGGRFNLEAASDRRYASVAWEGTRGVNDVDCELSIDSWFGEVRLSLRANRDTEERVQVVLTEGRIRVLQESDGVTVEDMERPWLLRPDEGCRLRLDLRGEVLRISGAEPLVPMEIPIRITGTADSRMELSLHHLVHGAAVARGVELTANPHGAEVSPGTLEGVAVTSEIISGEPSRARGAN